MNGPQPHTSWCRLCGYQKTCFLHRSRADGMLRSACAQCWSRATVLEDAGKPVGWLPGHTEPADQVEDGLW